MKKFNEIFGKVMIEITPTEVDMLGTDTPVVTVNGNTFVEFVAWANKALSPNLNVCNCYLNGCRTCVHVTVESFNDNSSATLKANGFKEWTITAEVGYEENGCPVSCLVLNIPIDYYV